MGLLTKTALKVLIGAGAAAATAIAVVAAKKVADTKRIETAKSFGLDTQKSKSISNSQLKEMLNDEIEQQIKKYNSCYNEMLEIGEAANKARLESVSLLKRAENLVNSIARHPKEFDTAFLIISQQYNEFKSIQAYAKQEYENAKKSAISGGVGVAGGAAVAAFAPSVAMWIATTYGVASTGAAISTLSGAAASKAALAWLGGGALAVGGKGVVAGKALLALAGPIGIGIAATSVITASLIYANRNRKIINEKGEEVLAIKQNILSLKKGNKEIESLYQKTVAINEELDFYIRHASILSNCDYERLDENSKYMLGSLVNTCKITSSLLSERINDDN